MFFQILKIVLWPSRQSPSSSPRVVELQKGIVNVISGASKTGKSAIIPIIDYCLGADRCAIPVETIRNSCSWFGVLIQTDMGQKLFARREPGVQKSTGEMFVVEGETVEIPKTTPTKNTSAEAMKTGVDDLGGLTRLDFDVHATGSGFKGRPSFRDMMAFTFQPQNIVANPDVLFFKADTYEHREKLKTIFPYVLNAVSSQVLADQHELENVRRELSRKERELDNLRDVSERWLSELRAWAVQARELGLVDMPIGPNANREELLGILQNAVVRPASQIPSSGGIADAMQELTQLQVEERQADTNLRMLHRRLSEMSKLKENAERFGDALRIQRDRLAISKWLRSLDDKVHICPICDNTLETQSTKLEELFATLTDLEVEVSRASTIPASFDREMLRVREEIKVCIEKLRGISMRKAEVEARSEEAKAIGFRARDISRFAGRVENGLKMHEALGAHGTLADEVEELKERERSLAKAISSGDIERRKRRALDKIASLAGRLLPHLDAERPNDPIELSVSDLTLKVKGPDREDYLWEIGSGANWLSYHVAISLGLQEFFIGFRNSPVPGFIVYDQPSQVYFPRKLAGARNRSEETDPQFQDEDIEAVRKVFETLANVVQAMTGKLQVLVLDHAGPNVWGNIPGVHLVEEWRGGAKLVPAEWL